MHTLSHWNSTDAGMSEKISEGNAKMGDLARLESLAFAVKMVLVCGLGAALLLIQFSLH